MSDQDQGDPVARMRSYGVYESDDAFFVELWTREGEAAWAACTDVAAMLSLSASLDASGAVRAACACARVARDDDPVAGAAFDAADAWCRGDAVDPLTLDELARAAAEASDARVDAAADDDEIDTRALDVAAAVAQAAAAAGRLARVMVHAADAPNAVDTAAQELRDGLDQTFTRLGERLGDGAAAAATVRASCPFPTLAALTAARYPIGEPAAYLAARLIWGRALPAGWTTTHAPDGTLAAVWAAATDVEWLLLLLYFAGDRAGLDRALAVCPRDTGVLPALPADDAPSGHFISAISHFVEGVARALAEADPLEPPEEVDGWEEAVAIETVERRFRRALAADVRAASACPSLPTILAAVEARQRLIAEARDDG